MMMSAYAYADAVEDWSRIHARECPLIVEQRTPPVPDTVIAPWLERAPFAIRAEGNLATVMVQLGELPDALCTDVAVLVQRFMLLMQEGARRLHRCSTDYHIQRTGHGLCPKRRGQRWVGILFG